MRSARGALLQGAAPLGAGAGLLFTLTARISAPNLTSSRNGRQRLRGRQARVTAAIRGEVRSSAPPEPSGRLRLRPARSDVRASARVAGRAPTARSPRAPCGPPGAACHRGAPTRMSPPTEAPLSGCLPHPLTRAPRNGPTPVVAGTGCRHRLAEAGGETFTGGRLSRGRHSPRGAPRGAATRTPWVSARLHVTGLSRSASIARSEVARRSCGRRGWSSERTASRHRAFALRASIARSDVARRPSGPRSLWLGAQPWSEPCQLGTGPSPPTDVSSWIHPKRAVYPYFAGRPSSGAGCGTCGVACQPNTRAIIQSRHELTMS